MPGKAHQRILGLMLKKAEAMGFQPVALDGRVSHSQWEECLPLPPQIGRHRPDAVLADQQGRSAVCEAKTWEDLSSLRTVEQLEDFLDAWNGGEYALLFFGFPQSADKLARDQLSKAGAIGCPHLVILSVPDEVLRG